MISDLQQFVALVLTPIALIASGITVGAIVIIGFFHAVVDTSDERG